MALEGITISEIVEATGLRRNTIEVRIHRLGIRPLSYEARYPMDTLEKVKAVKTGRPKKNTQTEERGLSVMEAPPPYGDDRVIDISRHAPKKDGVRFMGWKMIMLPHMGKVAAGHPIEIIGFTGEGVPFPEPLLKGNKSEYFTVEIKGTSMTEAGIEDGDIAVIRKAGEPKQNKIMLVRHEGDSTLKRIKIKETKEGREVRLCWEDGSGHSVLVDDDQYEVQGEFFKIMKR